MSVASSSSSIAAAATVAPSWRERAALLLLTAFAIGLRLFHIEQWSWSEAEAGTWRAITQPMVGDDGFVRSADSGSPLVYLLLRWLLDNDVLRSTGEGSLRLLFAFAGACTVPLVALLARSWLGARAAWFAGLLLAIHPAHVAASQTAAPLVVAMPLHLLAIAAGARRQWVGSCLCAAAAGLCAPGGWFAFVGVGAALLPERLQRAALSGLLSLALPQWLLAVPQLGWPIVLFGALAMVAPALPAVVGVAAALPAALLWLRGDGALASAFDISLPLLVVAAAHGAATATGWLHAALASRGRWRLPGALAPAMLGCIGLLVPTFLGLTIHRGLRPAWSQAAQLALRTVTAGGRLVVGAASGHGPLLCYLRPDHHRVSNDDPHPRRIVQALVLHDAEGSLRSLLANSGVARAVLVLTTAEHAELTAQPAASTLLLAAFEWKAVFPGPREHHDEALLVWVARARR